jgi:VWFA-related protein
MERGNQGRVMQGLRARFARSTLVLAVPACALAAVLLFAAQSATPPGATAPEISSHESEPNFVLQVRSNEVLVRVVVRDASGRLVTNLRQEDFRLFEDGKPQTVTHFTVETAKPLEAPATNPPGTGAASGAGASATVSAITLPTQFMALYFDDIHLGFEDLVRTRDAADHYLGASLKPGDRAGIFTSSGQGQLDFTDDRQKLSDALAALRPRPLGVRHSSDCPQILPYQAYQIVEGEDPTALAIAQQEALECSCGASISSTSAGSLGNAGTAAVAAGPGGAPGNSRCPQASSDAITHQAEAVLQDSERESHYALEGLERVCRRMQSLHGQRSTVLVSPGFMTLTEMPEFERLVDMALRQNVVISTLDARGLYTQNGLGDASENVMYPSDGGTLMNTKVQYVAETKSMNADVLISLADATGGVAFRNNNNFDEGFRRTGAFPDVYYVLAFSPPDVKPDGRFHKLGVTLADSRAHDAIQARKGYFDPNKNEDAAALAKEELETIAFSDNELHEIPVEFHTQFFKSGPEAATVAVLARVDVSHFHFHKVADRNLDSLTVIAVLFNQAGDYVAGQERDVEFHLLDSTLARLMQSGVTTRLSLPAKPGNYMVREIVRDSEGETSALNGTVEIP